MDVEGSRAKVVREAKSRRARGVGFQQSRPLMRLVCRSGAVAVPHGRRQAHRIQNEFSAMQPPNHHTAAAYKQAHANSCPICTCQASPATRHQGATDPPAQHQLESTPCHSRSAHLISLLVTWGSKAKPSTTALPSGDVSGQSGDTNPSTPNNEPRAYTNDVRNRFLASYFPTKDAIVKIVSSAAAILLVCSVAHTILTRSGTCLTFGTCGCGPGGLDSPSIGPGTLGPPSIGPAEERSDNAEEWVPYLCSNGSLAPCQMPPIFQELMHRQSTTVDLPRGIYEALNSPDKPKYVNYNRRYIKLFLEEHSLEWANAEATKQKLRTSLQQMHSKVARSFSTGIKKLRSEKGVRSPHLRLSHAETFLDSTINTWTYFREDADTHIQTLEDAFEGRKENLIKISVCIEQAWDCGNMKTPRSLFSFGRAWDCQRLKPEPLLSMITTMYKEAELDTLLLAQYKEAIDKVEPALKEKRDKILAMKKQSPETIQAEFDPMSEVLDAGQIVLAGQDIGNGGTSEAWRGK
ncbi:hypothetical protein P171DRAFT_449892 [Karstenula rhodostoma CBS 690.94]|uniref:Uncharacterized protein n=1 Tax=Karstenula rhodostoma CBS 690.94 TaxID=1392251 RepID=A0A9P4P5N5_9PLEO|nr:hypothetical protein P171DRAFT_449892 [Karstenula rhodostoma CBS 690.94]